MSRGCLAAATGYERAVAQQLMLIDGGTLFLSRASGDVLSGEPLGYFFEDVRHLSRWELLLDGEPLEPLLSDAVDYYAGRIVAATSKGDDPDLSVQRDRFVMDGFHEDIDVTNLSDERRRVTLELRFDADFADVTEAQKPGVFAEGARGFEHDSTAASISVELGRFARATELRFSEPGRITRGRAVWRPTIEPQATWHTCVDVAPRMRRRRRPPLLRCGSFAEEAPQMPETLAQWFRNAPELSGGTDALRHVYRQSIVDLASLRLRPSPRVEHAMPAGGVPWFMAVFGRDSILASYQALPFVPTLARATLVTLAALQATRWDNRRDAEPGKMPHELRRGKDAALGRSARTPYYGTHDATPLWLVLLDEYERWTGDTALVRRLEPNARRAVEWIEGPGDLDGDGYLEYRRRSPLPDALNNQCWKDSDGSIVFDDGRPAEPPIATCEVQGYAYDARVRTARLTREVWRDPEWAERLEHDAAALKERFDGDFWLPRRRHYALALDRDKRPVDALASNIGHLLWSGIASEGRVAATARSLVGERLFSGWGIRSLAAGTGAYNPLEYHNGTVWPHDTALCAEGLRRAGRRREAAQVVAALLDAAERFDRRLPEVFAGFARDEADRPVPYAEALVPQAWAAAAPLLALRTILGLDVVDGALRVDPALPRGYAPITLRGLRVRGRRVDVG